MDFLFGWFYRKFAIDKGSALYQAFNRCFLISLGTVLAAAVFSLGFHHFDEHWQILEFMGLKLGMTSAELLPWEYPFQMRSWAQPFLHYILVKVLFLEDPFAMALVFRLFTGLVSWYGLCAFTFCARYLYRDDVQAKWAAVFLAITWYLPYLKVRPSAEVMGGAVFALGVAILAAELYSSKEGERSGKTLFWSGLVCGLSFVFRFQMGVPVFFVWVWLLIFGRATIAKSALFAVGVCLGVAIELPIDVWGYGRMTFVPWNYFYQNLVLDKVSNFPMMPWWYNITAPLAKGVPPFSLMLIVAQLLFWALRPKHLLTWATLSLYLIHTLIATKAVRYLFPLAMMAPILLPWMHALARTKLGLYDRFVRGRLAMPVAKALLALNLGLLAYATFWPARPVIGLYKFVHEQGLRRLHYYGESPYSMVGLGLMFYRPKQLELVEVEGVQALASLGQQEEVWLLSKEGADIGKLREMGCRLEYSTFPQWAMQVNVFNWVERSRLWALFRCGTGQSSETGR